MSMRSQQMNAREGDRWSWISLALLACVGCGASNPADVEEVANDVPDMSALSPAGHPVALEVFDDDVGPRAATQTRALIRTLRGYEDFFGHAPPSGVDFSREWVIFYAAGTKPTGGYVATVLSLTRSGGTLSAVTQLVSPGADCGTTESLTTPHVLVKFAAQPGSAIVFRKKDVTKSCDVSKCAAVQCVVGSTCDPTTGACIPGTTPVRCGGFSGAACPGSGKCVDDPSDSCDPAAGGADCGGLCQCVQNVACTKDTTFDSSPSVCACVPAPPRCGPVCEIFCQYGNVLDANGCPTCQCKPDPCAALQCAAGTHCEAVEPPCIPNSVCSPIGACVPNEKSMTCGGIAGIACPGAGKCVDDPSDSCDPKAGGADCSGICQCIQNVMCTKDAVFDSAPGVCACVPAPPKCGPVCAIYCEYGNVTDANGCPTCQCNPPPADPCATVRCAAGTHCAAQQVTCVRAPCPPVGACVPDKKAVSCGGIAGIKCPGGGKCVDDPADSCDPSAGGADCGGICQCVETVLCVATSRFDSSPDVCACVPVR